MKKTILALLLILPTFYTSAHAKLEASGYFMVTGQLTDQMSLTKQEDDARYKIYERIEVALDLLLKDDIKGQLKLRLPDGGKGQFGADFLSGASDIIPHLVSAYASFPLASTPFTARIGLQEYSLPAYLGSSVNPIFDSSAAGLVLQGKLGMMEPTFAWFVLDYPENSSTNSAAGVSNLFALSVPLSLSDSLEVNPWFALNESNSGVMYMGLTSLHSSNKLNAGLDFLYGQKDIAVASASSLLIDVYANYSMESFTPGFIAWYSTGKRGDNVGLRDEYTSNSTWASYNGTNSLLFADYNTSLLEPFTNELANPFGTIGLGLSFADIYLTKETNLSLQALYIMDNNENESDSIVELGTTLLYSMFDALDVIVDVNYCIPITDTVNTANGFSFASTLNINF